jgi:hypothetical protein
LARSSLLIKKHNAMINLAWNIQMKSQYLDGAIQAIRLTQSAMALIPKSNVVRSLIPVSTMGINGVVGATAAASQKLLTNSLGMSFNAPGTNNPSSAWQGVVQSSVLGGGFGVLGAAATIGASARGWSSNAADVAGMVIERSPISDTYP